MQIIYLHFSLFTDSFFMSDLLFVTVKVACRICRNNCVAEASRLPFR